MGSGAGNSTMVLLNRRTLRPIFIAHALLHRVKVKTDPAKKVEAVDMNKEIFIILGALE